MAGQTCLAITYCNSGLQPVFGFIRPKPHTVTEQKKTKKKQHSLVGFTAQYTPERGNYTDNAGIFGCLIKRGKK